MKLRYLAILVSTIILVGTVGAAEIYNKDGNKLDLFGTVNGMRYLSSADVKNGDSSFVRYGFNGETHINDQLIGFGMWESEAAVRHVDDGGSKNNNTRLGYAGIKFGNFDSIDYGRNYGVLYDVGAYTDVMPEFGGDTSIVDNFLSNLASGVATYRNTNFFGLVDGLNFALQYQDKNDSDKGTILGLKEANGYGYGVSISYTFDNGISTAAAYANSKHTFSQKVLVGNHGNNAEAYYFGLKYDANDLYLAALYGETRNMTPFGNFEGYQSAENMYGFIDKAKNIELVAQYQFDFGLRPSIGYLQSRTSDIISNGQNSYLKKYIEVGTSYNLNKNMLTFVDYRINLLKNDDLIRAVHLATGNILALGMTYRF
ncbi:MAG: outer membrane porin PhoE [Sodalis sp. Fse]|nr:MAG: outer membrane porin PhoE [Sodalis sp. Fse]